MTGPEESILKTLAFYDIFDLPLTSLEIFKFLIKANKQEKDYSFLTTQNTLSNLSHAKTIGSNNGFFYLNDRLGLINQRIDHNKIAEQRWKRFKKAAQWLFCVPFIKQVYVTGSLSANNASDNSDLDVLIVTSSNRLWIVRFLAAMFLSLPRLRRHGNLIKNRVCLHWFLEEGAVIEGGPKPTTLGLAQEFMRAIPIYLAPGTSLFDLYRQNKWTTEYLQNVNQALNLKTATLRQTKPNLISRLIKKALQIVLQNKMGDWIEERLYEYQSQRIRHGIKNPNNEIILKKDCLLVTPYSYDLEVLAEYQNKINLLLSPTN